MLEASSSFPFTGSGYATNYDLGNFDQCLTVDHVYEGGRILGEHCTKGLIAPNILEDIYDADVSIITKRLKFINNLNLIRICHFYYNSYPFISKNKIF